MRSIKNFYLSNRRRLMVERVKRKIDLSDISIISMNCIGGVMYYDLKQKFITPTINLFFTPSDFIKFVNNLNYYLSIEPTIAMGNDYPIGKLDDITLYFMHYNTPGEALKKWEERKKRINKDKIFIIMVERDGFTKKHFEEFNKLNYPKFLFTKTKDFKCEDSLYMSKYKDLDQLPDIIPGRHIYDGIKLVKAIKKAYG